MSSTNIRFINTNSSITQKVGVGLSAIVGPTGPQGWQGSIGYQGFQGISGFSTNTGAQGWQGPQGWQGGLGPTGSFNLETGSFTFLNVTDLIATNFTGTNIRTTNIEAIDSTNLNIGSVDTQTINMGTSNITQTVNIGTVGLGSTTINIGGPGDQVRIAGDLVYINSSVDVLTNPYIILNNGNTSINNSGLIVAQTGSSSTGVGGNTGAYFLVNSTQYGWVAKAGNGSLVNLNQDVGTGANPYFTSISSTNLVTTSFSGTDGYFTNLVVTTMTGGSTYLDNLAIINGVTGSTGSFQSLTVQNIQMNSGATISAPYDTLFVDGNLNVGNIYTVNIANSNVQYCNFTGGNFVNTVTINGIGGYIYATGGTGIGYFKTAVANQFLGNPADTTSLPSHSWSGDQTCGLYHPLTSTIGFVTTGAERMRISAGGNVGIGTTIPTSKLTLYDTTTCRISVASFTGGETYSGILFYNTGNAGGAIFLNSSSRSGDGGANTLTLRNDIGVLRLQDTTSNGITIYNGNVGISYSTPSRALDVAGLHRFGSDGTAQFGGTGGSVFNILANNVPTLTSAGDFYIGQDKLLTSTNTVVGKQALNTIASHPTQLRNTAVGFLAGGYTTTGGYNVFLGSYAGGLNTIGTTNVYIGDSCAYGSTGGNNNVAIGYVALRSNGVASDNTSIGWFTMYNYTGTLGKNTVMGSEAGTTMVTNGNCTVLGYNAEPSTATVSNEITLGDASITVLRCNATTITSLSDVRDKTNITSFPSVEGFVKKLNPVQFEWNTRDGKRVGTQDYGFIAQEVDRAQIEEDKEWLNVVYKENMDRLELSQGKLIPVLVKALQECYSKIDVLRGEVEELKKQVV